MKPFAEWIGRRSESEDVVTDRLVASFRAIFEPYLAAVPEGVAPLGLHWCLSPVITALAERGPDGHAAKDRDLPPVPQPRRMWAGGAIQIFDPLRIGDRVRRISTIGDIVRKQGRSGELWFVGIDHDYVTERGVAMRERHDIVYREAARPGSKSKARPPSATPAQPRPIGRSWSVETSSVFLFFYSAVTFNGHRIHYDLPYATEVEGYDGLVVHGPVQATLLLNLAAVDGGGAPRNFTYRGISPAIAGVPLIVCAGGAEGKGAYWTQGSSGLVHMEAWADAAQADPQS